MFKTTSAIQKDCKQHLNFHIKITKPPIKYKAISVYFGLNDPICFRNYAMHHFYNEVVNFCFTISTFFLGRGIFDISVNAYSVLALFEHRHFDVAFLNKPIYIYIPYHLFLKIDNIHKTFSFRTHVFVKAFVLSSLSLGNLKIFYKII